MNRNEQDQLKKLIPMVKSISYYVGMAVLAPLVLKKLGAAAGSDIDFSFRAYEYIQKWLAYKISELNHPLWVLSLRKFFFISFVLLDLIWMEGSGLLLIRIVVESLAREEKDFLSTFNEW